MANEEIKKGTEIRWDYDEGNDERVLYKRMIESGVPAAALEGDDCEHKTWTDPTRVADRGSTSRRRTNDVNPFATFDNQTSSDESERVARWAGTTNGTGAQEAQTADSR